MTVAGRATALIFAGVALATTGVYAGVTLAPVLARDLTGSAFLAGLPVAALLAGAGGGAMASASLIRRRGRRTALVASYATGAAACAVAVAAVALSLFPLLVLALLGIGGGHAANQLARYAAAELHEADRRPSVIGWIVWAQAVGAVAGPLLLAPASRLAGAVDAPPETGAYVLAAGLFVVAAGLHVFGGRWVHARGRREAAVHVPGSGIGVAPAEAVTAQPLAGEGGGSAWARPTVRVAAVALIGSQVVMLLLMTMTPVHAQHGGHGLGTIGAIMSAHTFGMFALAPLAGRLVARFGSVPVIAAGLATLLAAAVWAAAVPVQANVQLSGALFLLGLGWCLSFVAASALLTRGAATEERAAVQARIEALTWTSGATASVASGLLLGWIGFALLCLLGASLVAVPVLVLARHRQALAATAAPA